MISGRTITITVISVLVGTVSFFGTRAIASKDSAGYSTVDTREHPCQALVLWLDLSPQQAQAIAQDEPTFEDDCCQLNTQLDRERDLLAAMLADVASSKQEILSQVERVISAHNDLQRRVAQYVLAVRDHLTLAQQKKLMGLCAQSVRRRPCDCLGDCKRKGQCN